MDDFEASFEEDDRRDVAIRKIQKKARVFIARKVLRKLTKLNYVKVFDRASGDTLYKNKKTATLVFDKPSILGQEDLPSPRAFQAPSSYDPGSRGGGEGYAIVVTNTTYNSPKLPVLSQACLTDHSMLEDIISHDFICRIPNENTTCLTEVTSSDFIDAFKAISKRAKRKNFLFVYICTQALTVLKGNSTHSSENCYLAMANTVWTGNPKEIANSAVSLNTLIGMLNKIKCIQKTVFLNVAHQKKVPRSIFSSKATYPPDDMYTRLADGANCAVVGSCTIGTSISTLLQHTPYWLPPPLSAKKKASDCAPVAQSSNSSFVSQAKDEGEKEIRRQQAREEARLKALNRNTPAQVEELTNMYLKDWQVLIDTNLYDTKPKHPQPSWSLVEKEKKDTDGNKVATKDFVIKLPPEEEIAAHLTKLRIWQVMNLFRAPIALFRSYQVEATKSGVHAPCQSCAEGPSLTLFGRAVIAAMKGEASSPSEPFVSAFALFRIVHQRLLEEVEKINAPAARKKAEQDAAIANGSLDPAKADPVEVVAQTPVLLAPAGRLSAMENTLCFKIAPPPAPEGPFILLCGDTFATLGWYDPTFDGIAPTLYEIYMRSDSRVYSEWLPINYRGKVTGIKFTVRDLPSGISCQFKVRAFSSGGWGLFSSHSARIIPGEYLKPANTMQRMKKLEMGGQISLLDRMGVYPLHRDEHRDCLRRLVSYAHESQGFKQGVQLKVAVAALHAIRTFPEDVEIASHSFLLMGWAMKGKAVKKVRVFLLQNDIGAVCDHYMEGYREHGGIINALTWLRLQLPNNTVKMHTPLKAAAAFGEKDESSDSDADVPDEEIFAELVVDEAKEAAKKLANG